MAKEKSQYTNVLKAAESFGKEKSAFADVSDAFFVRRSSLKLRKHNIKSAQAKALAKK